MAAPPKVMWGVDDEIRTQLDIAESMLKKSFANQEQMIKFIKELLTRVEEMIFKEENIMFPMLVEKLTNCHPPTSVHMVEQIVADFKSGKKDNEDFWIAMGERFVLIRYFAVRNDNGEYMGVLEVTQDIAPIKALTGEKRLVSH